MNRRIVAIATLIAAGLVTAGPAAAELLTPWEKFCLNTSKPGQDLANCLDGLTYGGAANKVVTPRSKPRVTATSRVEHQNLTTRKQNDAD